MRLAAWLVRGGALTSLLVTTACSLLMDTNSLTNGNRGGAAGITGDQSGAGTNADAGNPDPSNGGNPGAGNTGSVGGTGGGAQELGGSAPNGGSTETGGMPETGGGTQELGGSSGNAGTSGDMSTTGGTAGGAACIPGPKEYCDGLDNDCNAATPDVCPPGCTGNVYQGEGYMVCNGSFTYAQGETACEAQSMRLVRINDAAENAFVLSLLKPITLYGYIGGTDAVQRHTFVWPDGTVLYTNAAPVKGLYQNFSNGEPDTVSGVGCLQMTRGNSPPPGTWSDTLCSEQQPFVCERY